ncbi:MAG: HRDC domain-containing protein, partial [Polyangiaceae bacterium]
PAAVFEKVLEKLWVHGGALVDPDDTVRRGSGDWRVAYERQRVHKRAQLDKMRRFAELPSCRMLQLVGHFGDQNDEGTACGLCDVCLPGASVAQTYRAPTARERDAARLIFVALGERDGRAVGQLHRDLFADGGIDRRALEGILGALARTSAVSIVADAFEKDGQTIAFQRVWLDARADAGAAIAAMRVVDMPAPGAVNSRGRGKGRAGGRKARVKKARVSRKKAGASAASSRAEGAADASGSPVEAALRAWRLVEAKKRRVPAFRILTDRTLVGIASARPSDETELLAVPGIGPALLAKHGRVLLDLVAGSAV